jgi:hypothetical protein
LNSPLIYLFFFGIRGLKISIRVGRIERIKLDRSSASNLFDGFLRYGWNLIDRN